MREGRALTTGRLVLKEGRNRVVRRTFEALGLTVSRLMRVRFGIINLPPSIKRGKMAELGTGEVQMILDWVGLAAQPLEEAEPIQEPKAQVRQAKGKVSTSTRKSNSVEPVKSRQRQSGTGASGDGRRKTKAGGKV